MPQLEFETFPSQLFWLFLTFFAFYALISTFIAPRLQKIVEGRDKKIKADLKEITLAEDEIRRIHDDISKMLEKSKSEAHALILKNIHEVEEKTQYQLKDIDQRYALKLAQTEKNLELKTHKLLSESDGRIEHLVEKILHQMTPTPQERRHVQ